MNYLRVDAIPVVWRKTVKEKTVPNLFGGRSLDLAYCNECKTYQPKVNFYFEPPSKRNYPEQLRPVCIPCFEKQLLAYKKQNLENDGFSIEDFI